MKIKENSLVAQYIRAIENPDSAGYKDGRWYAPTGMDPNNRGFGVDVEHNLAAKALTANRGGQWLTEGEERKLRNNHIDYIQRVLEDNTPSPYLLRQYPSKEKKAMLEGMMYRGNTFSSIMKKNPEVRDAYYLGSDEDMQKAVSKFYKKHKVSKRAELHDKFFNARQKPVEKHSWEKPITIGNPKLAIKPMFAEGGNLNNQWDNLSMNEKAEMMKVAVSRGLTSLPEIKQAYNEFAKGGTLKDWTVEDEVGYRHWRSKLPKNLRDTKDSDYDMRAAYKAGAKPLWNDEDKAYHLQSRDPESGRILKAGHHPTYMEALMMDAKEGYYPHTDKEGHTYTQQYLDLHPQYSPSRQVEVPYRAFGGNIFGYGGKKNDGTSNAERAMNYLLNRGMSATGAAAIVGTLQAESNLDPTIHAKMKGDDGEGLAQWTGSRKKEFWNTLEAIEPGAHKKYGSISKVPLERQLDVVLAERPDVTNAIHTAKDVGTATDIMLRGFENGGGSANTLATKAQMDRIYGKWNNGYNTQMKRRLGNATNLLGLKIDSSSYEIPQTFFDDINAQISNANVGSLHSDFDVDPEFRYKPIVIDETMFQQPKQEDPVEEMYDPRQERLEGFRNINKVMGLMGMETPFTGISSPSSTPGLLAMVNSIYGS